MPTTAELTENSRQGFEPEKPDCTGLEHELSRYLRQGYGHVYDETPADLAVYVRNDPVNYVDPDGKLRRYVMFFSPVYSGGEMIGFEPNITWYDEEAANGGGGGGGGQRPSWQLQWDKLSEDCKKGLTTAMGGTGSGAIESRIGALNRAKASMGMLQAITAGSVIDASMIAAIGIRETGFRNINGGSYQDNQGNWHENLGRGVFQIDIGQHPEVSESLAMNTTWAATWAMNYLRANYSELESRNLGFDSTHFQQALAASYNFGTGNISGNPDTIDVGSTNNNYGSNILDLMACFK